MRKWFLVVMPVTMASLAGFACGGGDKSLDLPGGGSITEGKLPDDWPDDFPVYDGAKLLGGVSEIVDGSAAISATWETGDSADDVKQFYDEAFADGPWKSESSGVAGGGSFWLARKDDGAPAYVTVADSGDDKRLIVVVIGNTADDIVPSDGSGDEATPDEADSGSDPSGGDLPEEVPLPDGFPSDRIPLPPEIRITNASSVNVSGAQSFLVQLYSKDSSDDLAAFFQQELTATKGFTQSIQTSQDGGIYAAYSENDDGSGAIVIVTVTDGDVAGYRQVTLQVTETAP